ncbi:MAG: GerW family sporulation protein [Oscillospiraceae bacterium]|nr:GerW family sporulation protein [Oscillospiraceae bacterium]
MSNPISEIMDLSMDNIRKISDANTVVGQPILCQDGTTVIPISRVRMGYAGGGSEFTTKNSGDNKPYGAGSGASVTVTPIAFLVNKDGACRVLPIPEPAITSIDRIIELVPDIAEKVFQLIEDKKTQAD